MRQNRRGQGTIEMLFILPVFIILAGATMMIGYTCWQGIKVQQAANLGARMAGQEVVNGAKDFNQVMSDNGLMSDLGVRAVGDRDPSECSALSEEAQRTCLENILRETSQGNGGKLGANAGNARAMYWGYRTRIYKMFSDGEQKTLYVPAPTVRNGTVQVTVARIIKIPKIMNWDPAPISVVGRAYGGEDTYQYSLPRFGTVENNDKFWQKELTRIAGIAGNGED